MGQQESRPSADKPETSDSPSRAVSPSRCVSPTASISTGSLSAALRRNKAKAFYDYLARKSVTALPDESRRLTQVWAPPSLKSDFETVVSRGIVQLGVELLRQVRRSGAADGNVVLSPYAVASALEELMVGASGDAAAQIAAALRVPPGSRVSAYFINRDRDMPSRDPTDGRKIFDMAYLNSIHHDERVATMDTSRIEQGEEEPVRLDRFRWDFAENAEQSRTEIDSYGRLIASAFEADEIMPKGTISPSSSVCFLSVFDFRGSWKLPFDDCTCTRDVFHESATVSSDVLMIHMTGHFRVAHCTDLMARALELPYQPPGGGGFGCESDTSDSSGTSTPSFLADAPLPASNTLAPHLPAHTGYVMVILLPDEELDSLVEQLSTVTVLRILSQLRPKGEVHASLPLFKVKQVHDLGPVLSELGVVDAFSERTELWGAAAGELRVSSLRHAASFEVAQMAGRPKPRRQRHHQEDQHGASVTHRIVSLVKSPHVHEAVNFTVNKPFIFLVVAKRPDTFLMLGSMRKVAW